MKAIIKLDVPEWQIGQEVSVYFPDTMMKRGICEKDTITDKLKEYELKESFERSPDRMNGGY
ncbi:MAG: hypothetical protein J6Y78_16010 [Paludibacteraceae bacterium]|nr:hypothetical protein [Paludibacteraceae bacterium]